MRVNPRQRSLHELFKVRVWGDILGGGVCLVYFHLKLAGTCDCM